MKKVNKVFVVCLAMIMTFPAVAQDATSDNLYEENTDFLGTIIQQQLEENPVAENFFTSPEDEFIDPDFLKDDVKAYDDYPKVTVRILDKITADTKTFDLDIGKTVAYGALRIRPQSCKKAPPIEEPESASFLQIWEKMHEGADQWVFSGWMFASSPSLSSMEHPVYDVWVIDCKS
jgi:hypothetical protein